MNDALSALDPSARTLRSGDLHAVFLPGRGMLGASLQHRGEELLGRVEDLGSFAQSGRTCGIPLLHPWANRLAAPRYAAAGREVSLDAASALIGHDGAGLPMHGVPWPRLQWQVTEEAADSLSARLDWHSSDLLAAFPYPHRLEMTVLLSDSALTIVTTLAAEGDVPVPLSFGFHPYLRLPGLPRAEWLLGLPAMSHLQLDARGIPTGPRAALAATTAPLGARDFDDGFALLDETASFSISGAGRRIGIEFVEGYTHAQVYAPCGHDFIAIEPMTAPTNALVSGDGLRVVEPGGIFRAAFRIHIQSLHGTGVPTHDPAVRGVAT